MAIVLQKAGFNVLPSTDCPADDDTFKARVAEEMAKCSCSLHILSGEYGRRFESDDETSFPKHQFMEAKKTIDSTNGDFNTFVWLHPDLSQIDETGTTEFHQVHSQQYHPQHDVLQQPGADATGG